MTIFTEKRLLSTFTCFTWVRTFSVWVMKKESVFSPNHQINNFFDPSHFYFLCGNVTFSQVWREALDCERVKECPPSGSGRSDSETERVLGRASVARWLKRWHIFYFQHCVSPLSILKGEIKTKKMKG